MALICHYNLAMPTIITHGIVALALAAKTQSIRMQDRARLLLVCILCSILPDIDVIGFKLGVQYNSLFGHRGFTHSFFFAALVALLLAFFFHRRHRESLFGFTKLFLLLFVATGSHSLLDAMTNGGEGVAFFSPFSNHRYFFPWRPIMVSPLGISAFFSWRGLFILLNEFLLVIFPLTALLFFPVLWKKSRAKTKVLVFAALAAWIFALSLLMGLYPLNNISMTLGKSERPVIDLFIKQYRNPNVLQAIPTAGIPDARLVTNFLTFQKLGLYNRRLESNNISSHWASGFFPNWFGGIAGRWQDSNVTLLIRTFLGYGVPDSREILEVLKESTASAGKRDFLFKLSPAEKYDLIHGDYSFTATKSVMATTHNSQAMQPFWFGICNGMAAASKMHEEPFRTVDVINPNGFRIRFHPNDVKALLGLALAEVSHWTELGTRCNVNGPEAEGCRVNAGAFFLATMNRIALARDAFIVDGFSGTRKQFYLFDAVRVEVLKKPTPVSELKAWAVPTPVKQLAEVRFTMDLVSTLLGDKEGGYPDEAAKREGFYKKVGRVVVPRVLDAVLALDEHGEVIGGSWLGSEDVPDVIFFPSALPSMDDQDRLKANPAFNWKVIKHIYSQSISNAEDRALMDFSL